MLCNQLNVPLTNGQKFCHQLLYDPSKTIPICQAEIHHDSFRQFAEKVINRYVIILHCDLLEANRDTWYRPTVEIDAASDAQIISLGFIRAGAKDT